MLARVGYKRQRGAELQLLSEESERVAPISIDEVAEREVPGDELAAETCFGCKWDFGKPKDPDKEPEMQQLYQCFQENLGKRHVSEVWRLMSKVQYALFVKPLEGKVQNVPPRWSPEQIKVHMEHHCVFPEYEVFREHQVLRHTARFLEKHLASHDPTVGGEVPNYDAMRAYLAVRKEKELVRKAMTGL